MNESSVSAMLTVKKRYDDKTVSNCIQMEIKWNEEVVEFYLLPFFFIIDR